jgi:hypothetical protein
MKRFSFDDLAIMPDDDLLRLESSIKSQIGRLKRAGGSGNHEVDLCYVQREVDIRRARAAFNMTRNRPENSFEKNDRN